MFLKRLIILEREFSAQHYLQQRGITSCRIPGGNWNVQDPIGWTRDFGRHSQAIQDHSDKVV